MLEFAGASQNVRLHDIPANTSKILHANTSGPECKQSCNYCAVVSCLHYIQAMTQPILSYSVHQCAHFCNSPKLSHKRALKSICQYLKATYWAGNWIKSAPNDLANFQELVSYLRKPTVLLFGDPKCKH